MALDMLSDTNSHQLVDKLRTIRPFSESQLLTLYNNSQLDSNQQFVDQFVEENLRNNSNELLRLLVSLEKCREKHETTNNRVEDLKRSAEELQEKVWQLNHKTISKTNRCSDGRIVEAVHKYNESVLNNENLKKLDKSLLLLKECVSNDNCINYYLSQSVRLEIENFLTNIINEKDFAIKQKHLRNAISALFAYQRRAVLLKDKELTKTTLNWLLNMSSELLSMATLDDHLFLLNHVLRCAAGSSIWSSGLIQCPNPISVSDSELSKEYMNHCVTIISTILSPIKMREKFIGITSKTKNKNKKLDSDETWHLVDSEMNGEDVINSDEDIAELDIIRFLKQVPFNDVLKYASMNENTNDVSNSNSFGESIEIKMLKLLAFSTKLIQILRQGLHSFNCLRFKELSIYISSMIRRTVLAVSELWLNCKTHFISGDQALILRLQVEFDHFMLRSMIAILTTNRQGVWNFLSVFPFDGVSESMMWHILWVVYNNGRDELDELGGLCPYFSVNYWKNKFQEATVQFLFKEKLVSLTFTESQNLLTLMYNMAISRNGSEKEYISMIIKEVFAISLQTPELRENMAENGKQIVIKLISRHNSLISVLIRQLLDNESNNSVKCIDLFCEIPVHLWNPKDEDLDLLSEWLTNYPIDNLLNRIARIILCRLNWSYDSTNKELFIEIEKHQKIALELFASIVSHNFIKTPKDFINSNSKLFGSEALLSFAQSVDSHDFMRWVWNLLITLKLHSLEWEEHSWDYLFNGNPKPETDTNGDKVLQLNFDTNLIPICRGLEEQNPFAIYLALVMTDFGKTKPFEKCLEYLELLLTAQHNIPSIHLLFTLIPFHLKQYKSLISSTKLVNLLSHLFSEYNKEIVSMICHQLSKLNDKQNKLQLLICWTDILYEVIGTVVKTNANSWFSSGQSRLQQISYIFNKISLFVYLDQNLRELYLKYISENPYDIQSWKLQSSGWFSSLFSWGSGSIKKCEWITPLHLIHKQNPNDVWLGWLLIEADSLRTEKIWDEIVHQISNNTENSNLEIIVKAICQKHNNSAIPLSLLPINSWSTQLINASVKPANDLEPFLWFKFFELFFTSSESSHSIGLKFIGEEKRKKMISKLNSLIDFHHSIWLSSDPNNTDSTSMDDRLAKLYRAYILWLEDSQLHDVFVNIDELPPQYLKDLLRCAIANTDSHDFSDNYLNLNRIQTEVSKSYNLWLELHSTALSSDKMFDENECNNKLEEEKPVNPPEVKKSNLDSFNIDIESINNTSALLLLIQHNVRVVLEEAKFFENLLIKFEELNKDLMKWLPDLYHNIKKEVKLKVACEKDNYDPNGCTGAYAFNIEFIEATLNQHSLKSIEKNRIDFDNTVEKLIETPSNKVVLASLFIEKSIPLLIESYDFNNCETEIERSLLGSLLSWLNDTNYLYPPSKQVFTNLIDSLGPISEKRADETNQFVLETAINNPKIIEYIAPRLLPSKTSSHCFLDMYRLIQEKLTNTPAQISFVLLSKFDVPDWFRKASHEQCLTLIQILGNALNSFGNKPKDEYSMVFGLYRKHLQYAIIYQFPNYLSEVLTILLKGMKSLSIAPCLWNDVLLSFGFFINKEDMDLQNFSLELKKYSNNQPLFTSNELFDILCQLSTQLFDAYNDIPQEFLDHFRPYIKSYLTLVSTLSFCWLNTNSRMPPSDITNVWRPFYDNWSFWIFPKRSTRFITSEHFQLVWDLFLININYFIECFQGMLSSILSCVWQVVLSYIIGTKAIDAKDLLVIQSKIQTLNWNRFCPNLLDIKIMYEAVIQDQYSIESFVAYVFSRIDWRHTLQNQSLTVEQMALIVENMSYTMISLSNEKCSIEIDLHSIPFELLTATKVQTISQVIVRIIKLKSYFFGSNNKSHRFLTTLLKQICLISSFDCQHSDREWLLKHKFYANSVSYLIKDLSSGDNELITKYPNEIKIFIKQCFEDLMPTFQSDIDRTHRIEIFGELLKCMNDISDDEIRKIVTEQYANGFNFERPQIICDLIQSTAQTVRHIPSFLILCETYISNYFTAEGNVSELIEVFQIPENSDDFMVAAITRSSSLTLITYLLTKLSTTDDSKRFVSNYMNWCSQLRPNADDESKVLLLWFKLLTISESLIDSEDNSIELIQSVQRFCKNLFDIVEETVYQGFLSFMRTNRKAFSERCTLLILCLSLNGIKYLNDSIRRTSPLVPDLNSIYKSALNKLQSLKKNKTFVDLLPLIETMTTVIERDQSTVESTQLIRHWLTTFYSDNCFLTAFL